ncbi:MAG: NAD+ synthase [Candidatus Marinimicrobia bacterium]|nr:NAD+ synthase [Candidatus Neomarinimicrobiota bacterium]
MKIALCQINPIVGSFSSNIDLIKRYYDRSIDKGADLVVFPEMSITGYPPQDLLWQTDFVIKNHQAVEKLSEICSVPMIVGYVRVEGNKLYNSAALCQDGKVCASYDKILLPTYDVFDERRYFSSGETPGVWSLKINGKKINIGIQICEDLWDFNYDMKVSREQKNNGAEIIINISASPYSKNRLKERSKLIKKKIKEIGLPIIYCNLVGAQDELVFDGSSIAFDEKENCIGQAASFKEDILLIDIKDKKQVNINYKSRNENIFNALCLGIKDYFVKTKNKEAVVGLSGGIDSAVVATLACNALGSEFVHGVSMPSRFSSNHSKKDAKELADNLGIDFKSIIIKEIVESMEDTLTPHFLDNIRDTTEENIQARIRGNLLMALSNKFGWLVLSTGNKTEIALGYCTLYGDMSGGLSVISDLNKADVYSLANWINKNISNVIPINTINKPPSAELAPKQVDPFDYEIVSPLVDSIIEKQMTIKELIKDGYNEMTVKLVYDKIIRNEYKRRQAPIGIRISKKAFGAGRRFPIVNHYQEETK